jgi:hypothetical protein
MFHYSGQTWYLRAQTGTFEKKKKKKKNTRGLLINQDKTRKAQMCL